MTDESPGAGRRRREQLESSQLIDAVRVREQFLEDILGSLESFVTVDQDWRFTFANQAAAKLVDRLPDELLGESLLELTPAGALERASAPLHWAMSERVSVEFEMGNLARGRVYHGKAYPLTDGGLAIYLRDVTAMARSQKERAQAEQRYRESQARLQIATEAAALGVHDFDVGAGTIAWDDRVREIWGVDPDEPVNYETFIRGLHPEDRAAAQAAVDAAVDPAGDGRYRATFRVQNQKDGSTRWVHATGRTLFEDRSAVRLVGTVEDITQRVRIEQALRQSEVEKAAQRERSHLARELHDSVTQALFAATMKSEALTLDGSLPTRSADTAEEVRRLTRGALAQMRTLLLELRADPLEEIPIQQLLRHLVEATESRVRTEVRLSVNEPATLPGALHATVYRIVQEALNNVARHAVAPHAWVVLDVRPSDVRLVVGDDGRGFDPDTIDPGHLGLRSMRERAEEAGARFRLETSDGGGTQLTVDWSGGGLPATPG